MISSRVGCTLEQRAVEGKGDGGGKGEQRGGSPRRASPRQKQRSTSSRDSKPDGGYPANS